MILVPRDAPGVKILHPMQVMGHEGDHAEMVFENVKVPVENIVLGEGRGFEIAQGRLGPGRIHHCMRTIGLAEMALSALLYRSKNRIAFGEKLEKKDTIRQIIAEARIEITKCRQLCYLAAAMADEKGFKDARKWIAMIKVAAPRMALKIVDEAIQAHGAHGISQYSRLADVSFPFEETRAGPDRYVRECCGTDREAFVFARARSPVAADLEGVSIRISFRNRPCSLLTHATHDRLRTLRLADGPDIVHMNTIAKLELSQFGGFAERIGQRVSGVNAK